MGQQRAGLPRRAIPVAASAPSASTVRTPARSEITELIAQLGFEIILKGSRLRRPFPVTAAPTAPIRFDKNAAASVYSQD